MYIPGTKGLDFKEYSKNGWYYGGRVTKKNFKEVAAFIERCTLEGIKVDHDAWTIQYKPNWPGQGAPVTVKIGDYVVRNVSGGDYGAVMTMPPHSFKAHYTEKRRWGQLNYYELTDVEYNILRALMVGDSDYCWPYSYIEDYTKVDRKETKAGMDHLRELGLVTFSRGLMTEDGEVAGSGFGMPDAQQRLFAELLMWRKQSVNGFDPDVDIAEKPGHWWVTNHDAMPDNKRVSGPYDTSHDAGQARAAIERASNNNTNYWVERLPE